MFGGGKKLKEWEEERRQRRSAAARRLFSDLDVPVGTSSDEAIHASVLVADATMARVRELEKKVETIADEVANIGTFVWTQKEKIDGETTEVPE